MKDIRYLLVATIFVMTLTGCWHSPPGRDILFQTSTISALLEGVYDGEVTFNELGKHGDFGIGTFNGLDGEMIGLDGKFYQIKVDGRAYPVDGVKKTPFAVVTFFDSDKTVVLDKIFSFKQLEQYLDRLLPTKNIFYAIKIEGVFKYIKTRSVPRQNQPYPPLVEVVENQPIFEFHNTKGTIVGFRCPAYVKGVNVPGYHFHFITEDRSSGGHLLECRMQDAEAEIDETCEFYMVLSKGEEFLKLDLTKEKEAELERVER